MLVVSEDGIFFLPKRFQTPLKLKKTNPIAGDEFYSKLSQFLCKDRHILWTTKMCKSTWLPCGLCGDLVVFLENKRPPKKTLMLLTAQTNMKSNSNRGKLCLNSPGMH